jgi:beta-lactamase class A
MTLVMDGVKRVSAAPMPMVLPKRKPVVSEAAVTPRPYVVGMDGIRRPVAPSPREVLANIQTPGPMSVPPAVAATPALAAKAPTAVEPWKMPSLRLPQIEWKRPAAAFALVALAVFASGAAMRVISGPKTVTANAESSQSAPSVAPSPVKVAAVTPQKTGLQDIINGFVAPNADKWGIVVKDLKTGQTASYQADRQIASASLYKLFVAERIYQQIDLGQLNSGDQAGGGSGSTIDGCLTIMINISDNTCGRALGTILGWGAQNQALSLEGYKETDLATPQQTSAADVARLFERLYGGTLVSPSSTQKFMGLLRDQRVNNRLPVGLPAGTTIAHKTGDLDGVVHDAGIVYGPKTDYLVVVTSGSWDAPGNVPPMFADLSQKLWNYFEQ